MYKIDKGKKIPQSRASIRKFPWIDMEIGDSFDMPLEENSRQQNQSIHGSAAFHRKKYNPTFKISVRKLEDCMRVWRVQ
jgi:hypothetical protein